MLDFLNNLKLNYIKMRIVTRYRLLVMSFPQLVCPTFLSDDPHFCQNKGKLCNIKMEDDNLLVLRWVATLAWCLLFPRLNIKVLGTFHSVLGSVLHWYALSFAALHYTALHYTAAGAGNMEFDHPWQSHYGIWHQDFRLCRVRVKGGHIFANTRRYWAISSTIQL